MVASQALNGRVIDPRDQLIADSRGSMTRNMLDAEFQIDTTPHLQHADINSVV